MKVGVYILLLFFLFFSCKQVETGHVTVIHLQPNEKSILKVSDYFNRVEAVLLRDTFFLTSSLRTPKFFVKEFSYFLMPCH
ncbi:hypothetical protein B5F99_14515, partial [Odoribacter splanchnicus]|uniref:hypothetical protein n=1 Tax=Odoribacter splanchnicus TaxID=28118 RepID=UPI000B56E67B